MLFGVEGGIDEFVDVLELFFLFRVMYFVRVFVGSWIVGRFIVMFYVEVFW